MVNKHTNPGKPKALEATDDNTNRALGLLGKSLQINESLVDFLKCGKASQGFVDTASGILSSVIKIILGL